MLMCYQCMYTNTETHHMNLWVWKNYLSQLFCWVWSIFFKTFRTKQTRLCQFEVLICLWKQTGLAGLSEGTAENPYIHAHIIMDRGAISDLRRQEIPKEVVVLKVFCWESQSSRWQHMMIWSDSVHICKTWCAARVHPGNWASDLLAQTAHT